MRPYTQEDRDTEGAEWRCDCAIRSETWGTVDEYQCRNGAVHTLTDSEGKVRGLCVMHFRRADVTWWHPRAYDRGRS